MVLGAKGVGGFDGTVCVRTVRETKQSRGIGQGGVTLKGNLIKDTTTSTRFPAVLQPDLRVKAFARSGGQAEPQQVPRVLRSILPSQNQTRSVWFKVSPFGAFEAVKSIDARHQISIEARRNTIISRKRMVTAPGIEKLVLYVRPKLRSPDFTKQGQYLTKLLAPVPNGKRIRRPVSHVHVEAQLVFRIPRNGSRSEAIHRSEPGLETVYPAADLEVAQLPADA